MTQDTLNHYHSICSPMCYAFGHARKVGKKEPVILRKKKGKKELNLLCVPWAKQMYGPASSSFFIDCFSSLDHFWSSCLNSTLWWFYMSCICRHKSRRHWSQIFSNYEWNWQWVSNLWSCTNSTQPNADGASKGEAIDFVFFLSFLLLSRTREHTHLRQINSLEP